MLIELNIQRKALMFKESIMTGKVNATASSVHEPVSGCESARERKCCNSDLQIKSYVIKLAFKYCEQIKRGFLSIRHN